MMKRKATLLFSLTCALALASCGTAPSDRVFSGAGLGAATGMVGGALANGNPIMGAAVGAAAGAIIGGGTTHRQIDLGRPVWK